MDGEFDVRRNDASQKNEGEYDVKSPARHEQNHPDVICRAASMIALTVATLSMPVYVIMLEDVSSIRNRQMTFAPSEGVVMGAVWLKGLIPLIPVTLLLSGSIVWLKKAMTPASVLQLTGAACLLVVALTHLCEAFHFLPWMRWGAQDSVGHYLDLASALLGLTLFPIGYLWTSLRTAKLQ